MIHALLVAARSGHVIYERFYCPLTEPEKAELRTACDAAGSRNTPDGQECVGRWKNARIVMIPSGSVLFYGLGSGDYTELALAEVLRALVAACSEILRASPLSDAALFQNYAALALIFDSAVKEGHVELLDAASIQRAIAFKLPAIPAPGGERQKGGGGLLKSRAG